SFTLADNLHKNTLFIVHEASMISDEQVVYDRKSLLEDLVDYVANGEHCKLLFVGDIAQLPPVGLIESPALNSEYLHARFGYEIFTAELTEVVRQEGNSGILFNATAIREQIRWDKEANEQVRFPKLSVKGFTDVYRMTGERLIEGLHYAYDK